MVLSLALSAVVGVFQEERVIEDFERPAEFRLGGMRIHPRSRLTLKANGAFEGRKCAELSYKFERVGGLQYLEVIAPHKLEGRPRGISVAVRGDGSGNILRVRFVDANGEWHQYDLGLLHFRGWRVLWTHLDTPHGHWGGDGNGKLDFPITFFSIVLDSLVRPSEGIVAFDKVTVYYGKKIKPPVDVKFEPASRWGYFWGERDIPSGKLKLTCNGNQPTTVEVSLRLLNRREELVRRIWRGEVTVSPTKPFERSISMPIHRFGVYFIEAEVRAPGLSPFVRRFSICWLPEPAPIWNDSPFGVCTHFGQFKHKVPETLELIKRMGAAWIRDELYWSNVEREKGKFEFPKYYDAYMEAAGKLGIQPLVIFDYSNRHYDNGLAPHTREGRKAFVRYCRELMKRYGRFCRHWEVWNEPNIGFWRPRPSPEDYTDLLKAVFEAVKGFDPKMTVVGVCTAGTDLRFIEEVLKLGGGKFMDAISVHPYRHPRSPEATDFVGEMKRLKNLLDRYGGDHLKVWITEFGYPTHITGGTPQWLSAAYIVRTFLLALTLPFVERVFLYDFQDDGEDPTNREHNFGLIRFDNSPKVGYAAFNTMVRVLHKKQFVRQVEVGEGIICLVFADDKGEVWALWSGDDGEREVRLTAPSKPLVVVDLMGNSREIRPTKGQIALTLTAEPIFLRISKAN